MKWRWLKRVAIALAAALACTVAAGAVRVWRSLPSFSGTLQVRGVSGPVEIVRDSFAIPHIYARTERDAYFALGFVHAQDRLFQMELARRAGAGTLAALLGERALDMDRLFRTLDLTAAARASLPNLDAHTRHMLSAYAAGINAWLDSGSALPIEFAVLRTEPAAWSAIDSLLVIKLMAWQLSGNMHNELRRLGLASRLSPEKLAQFTQSDQDASLALAPLFDIYEQVGLARPRAAPRSRGEHEPRGAALDRSRLPSSGFAELAGALARFAPAQVGRAIGSNNWTVAGTRTKSGKPLVANDPHLALSAPSQWYFAHLEAPGFKVIGASIPGLPGVILGRNADVAWAFTNMGPDTQDLYLEKLTDDAHYLTPTGLHSFARRREAIAVRGAASIELVVRETRHGPVISDVDERAGKALSDLGASGKERYALALAWAGLARDDETLAFPVHAARAKNVAELREAARHFHAPAQNVVFADRAGSIAFIGAGKLPQRAPSNRLRGLVPAPGWLADYDWTGFVPFAELPQRENPDSGRIVTANQNTLPDGYPHWLGADFGAPYRADRIAALLDQQRAHSVQSFARLQGDHKSTAVSLLRAPMLDALAQIQGPDTVLIEELRGWDGVMRSSERAPLVFASYLRALVERLAGDELGDSLRDEWEMSPEFLHRVLTNEAGHAGWCDDVRSAPIESCPQQAQRAFRDALSYLEARFGPDRAGWRWGAAHQAFAQHRLFGGVPVLGDLFNLSVAHGGDGTSVDVGSYIWDDPELAFANDWGASFRAVYDLSDLDDSRGVLNSGQSGHAASKHYRDMLGPWSRGELVPLTTRTAEIRTGALGSLWLQPTQPGDEKR